MARDGAMAVPDYVVAMVRRSPPEECPVVPGSVPVVAFGDPTRAEVATLGINPSAREFVEDSLPLTGDRRRLATLDALGAVDCGDLTAGQVAAVVADCAAYFQRRPYRRWFDPLDKLLRAGTDASYYDGSACHLDLVQWATDPAWSGLAADVQQALLDDGVPHLRAQLSYENVRLVVLNGRRVLAHVDTLGLADLTEVDRLQSGPPPVGCTRAPVAAFAGWAGQPTCRAAGASAPRSNGSWAPGLLTLCMPPTATPSEDAMRLDLTVDGHLPQGLRVPGKAALIEVLQAWLGDSHAATIGDIGSFGGKPWIWIDLDGWTVALNADTKRAAVEAVVRDHRYDPNRPWRVVANRRGRINKVTPSPDGQPLPGWYAYLPAPLDGEATI